MNARAPGKLILSGEHAVVHGRPALAMAVSRYVQASVTRTEKEQIRITLPGVFNGDNMPIAALHGLKHRLDQNYHQFLIGKLPVRHVLGSPEELIYYAILHLLHDTGHPLEGGLDVQLRTDLPVGAGMGSSAATIAAVVGGVAQLLCIPLDRDALYRLTLDTEKLQHGHPSGVDPFMTVHGGFVRFQQGHAESLEMPRQPMFLMFTGTPESTTGECVATVTESYPKDHAIWTSFEKITDKLKHALCSGDEHETRALVRENHTLLCQIGVVPDAVQRFIAQIENDGGAAKICGAGSVKGQKGGVVLVFASSEPTKRSDAAGYPLLPMKLEPHGMTVDAD